MRIMKVIAISLLSVFGLLVLLAAGTFFYARSGLKPLDDEARQLASGNFIQLSRGQVHYQFFGEGEDRPLIVLVHGFSTPSFVWQGLVPLLTASGFRVLAYDLYGRGWSDRPDVRHDAQLYEEQLLELLAALHIRGKMTLVGYSMGGAIVTHFSVRHPDFVDNLVLLAPAGLSVNSGGTAIFQLPIIGDWLMAVRGRAALLDVMRQPENQGKAVPDIVARYEQQMDYDGYLSALLSTLRYFPLGAMEDEYRLLGRQNFPVLAVFGGQDNVVPLSNVERLLPLVPNAQFVILDHAHHALTYSDSEIVAKAMLNFLPPVQRNAQ